MKKPRHIKTIPEKYGGVDVLDEALLTIQENYKIDHEELFDMLPYIGYLRIPVMYNDWWYDTNEGDFVNAKVVRVNKDTVDLYHYDSHHGWIAHMRPKFEGFYVEGNVLRKE